MNLNTIFEEKDYKQAFEFATTNGYVIKEIKSNDPIKRFFQIVEQPKPTQKELIQLEIEDLKEKLQSTDYKAIKFAEGVLTLSEYEPIREQRKQWREKINILENSLKNV